MKKIAILLTATFLLTFALTQQSCKAIQGATAKICIIAINDVCPSLQYLLNVGAEVHIEPTSNPGKYLISASGISSIVCDALGAICPIVKDALEKGQAVTITPVKTSSNRVKTNGNQVEVLIKIK